MGAIQPWHLILLLIIVLVIFGPGKLPDIGKSLGESIREFRKATTETRDAITAQPPVAASTAVPTVPVAPVAQAAPVAQPVVASAPAAAPPGAELPAASATGVPQAIEGPEVRPPQ